MNPRSAKSARRLALLSAAALALALLVGVSVGVAKTTRAGSTSASSAQLVVNDPVGPATLDEASNACGFEDQWANNFYRQLVRLGRKPGPYSGVSVQDPTKILPDVAKSWTESKDGKTYTFHLDPKAKFLDGTPINAAAVKFSFDRAQQLKSCGSDFWYAEIATDIPTITTPNATTVVARLKAPNQLLLPAWSVPGPTAIYEPSVVKQHPDTPGQSVNPYWANHIAGGGGPYILDQYVPSHVMVMHRNPKYSGPIPAQTAKVTANFGLSESSLLLQARAGAADVTFGLTPDDFLSLRSNSNLRLYKLPVQQFYSLGLNNSIAPFTNQTFREALSYAVPYQDILSKVLRGFGELFYGPIAHTLPHFNPKLSAPRAYNLAKAKALIQKSGVKTPVNVDMVLQQGAAVPAQMATIVQSIWKQLGVNVTLDTQGVTAYNTIVEAHKAQAFIRIDGPGAADPGWLLGYDMQCNYPFNLSVICIPQADKLLAKAEASTNQAVQQKLYNQITTIWRAHTPKIILANIDQSIAVSKKVKHYDWSVIAPEELHGIVK